MQYLCLYYHLFREKQTLTFRNHGENVGSIVQYSNSLQKKTQWTFRIHQVKWVFNVPLMNACFSYTCDKRPGMKSNHWNLFHAFLSILVIKSKYLWLFLVRSTDHLRVSGAIEKRTRVCTLTDKGNKSNISSLLRSLFLDVKVFYSPGFEL